MHSEVENSTESYADLTDRQVGVLLLSIMMVALCGITYELIIGTVSTYLLGNSAYQFSLTIGFFMFAMGLGAYLSQLFVRDLLRTFVIIEVLISLIGGLCSITLFLTYSALNSLYTPVMYTFIIVIGTLVGLEIPLLTRILSQKEAIRKSIAKVLSVDYLGALIGSVAFPLLLLPSAGLVRSSFVIGLINILTAWVNLIYFAPRLGRLRLLSALALGILVLSVSLVLWGSKISSFAEQHLYQDQVIYKKQTPFQYVVFTRNNQDGRYRMYIDGHIQFAERDEYRYHEALVHPVMSLPGPKKKILVLGGGDGLAVREILKYPEVQSVVVVDIDPEITRFSSTFPALLALNQGSLRNPKVHVINADAFNYIEKHKGDFDRVIMDLPDPHNEALSKLYSREFYRLIKRRLAPQGVILTQGSSPFFTRRTFWSIDKTLGSAGFKTLSYHITVPSFGIWGYHIASQESLAWDQFNFSVPMRFMSREILAAASVFPQDISRVDNALINSLMEPEIYMIYYRELNP